ncbi:hypothetical protein DAMA08_053000 [Martiniozyma asiatica (nom. inval.)]|nr:hypothetical protein DAMA08_053000 [Martiniozyma asiatica]
MSAQRLYTPRESTQPTTIRVLKSQTIKDEALLTQYLEEMEDEIDGPQKNQLTRLVRNLKGLPSLIEEPTDEEQPQQQ